uniref:Sterile alpha motif domain-containing protein 5 n=1 Tax=Oncorhynchus kisutch TaxID=8019 RepID=A0A8C7I8H0_ONCKI
MHGKHCSSYVKMMRTGPGLVYEWLQNLKLPQYLEGFVDNGYDDLEVCKQIGDPDLDAIGVHVQHHRQKLLDAVKRLREQEKEKSPGLYFTLEPLNPLYPSSCRPSLGTNIMHITECENDLQGSSSWTESNQEEVEIGAHQRCHQESSCPKNNNLSFTDCKELVIYPKLKLKLLIRDKLVKDGIDLSETPYTHKEKVDLVPTSLHLRSQIQVSECSRTLTYALPLLYVYSLGGRIPSASQTS